MTLFDRLDRWKDQSKISPEQHQVLSALARQDPFSVYLELNVLLYTGVFAFIGGLGWTIQTYLHQIGDIAIVGGLSALLMVCLIYCFHKGLPYSSNETQSPNLIFDYVLYLGCLVWSLELNYLETRFHIMAGQWDVYLLISALFFFVLAYRFDNRLVLSMALATLAAWFGLKISHFNLRDPSVYRVSAIVYSLVVIGAGTGLEQAGIKKHFFSTFLNFAANVLFVAILSGVFEAREFSMWTVALLLVGTAFLLYGIRTRQFVYVAYASVYGYIGITSVLLRDVHEFTFTLSYLLVSSIAMITFLTLLARRFGREA